VINKQEKTIYIIVLTAIPAARAMSVDSPVKFNSAPLCIRTIHKMMAEIVSSVMTHKKLVKTNCDILAEMYPALNPKQK